MEPRFTLYFFDIGHPCYDQLSPVKTRYPLTIITWPHCGLKFTAHQGRAFSLNWPLTNCWFSIGTWAHVRLTCWKQSRIVWKLWWLLRWFLSFALRIPTAHDIRVISARTWARARTNVRDFSQSKLDSEINAPFLLNKHGDLYFLLH